MTFFPFPPTLDLEVARHVRNPGSRRTQPLHEIQSTEETIIWNCAKNAKKQIFASQPLDNEQNRQRNPWKNLTKSLESLTKSLENLQKIW
jgi:hypothetical protein